MTEDYATTPVADRLLSFKVRKNIKFNILPSISLSIYLSIYLSRVAFVLYYYMVSLNAIEKQLLRQRKLHNETSKWAISSDIMKLVTNCL